MTTTNDLIPLEYQNRLLNVRGSADIEFWEIGDVANELEFVLPRTGDESADFEKLRALRNAVADLAGVVYKTVVDYQGVALYYPKWVREKYPNLTRYHFRHAKACGTLKESEKFLRLAEESADDYAGQPMPVRVLHAKILEAHPEAGRKQSLDDDIDKLMAKITKLCEHPNLNGSKAHLERAYEELRLAKERLHEKV